VTTSDNFTIPHAGTPTGRLRNFLMRVGPNGKDVKFARILPFGQTALPYVVTLDAQDNIFVAGNTDAAGLAATAGSAQPSVTARGTDSSRDTQPQATPYGLPIWEAATPTRFFIS
jgi:hypothetical protein